MFLLLPEKEISEPLVKSFKTAISQYSENNYFNIPLYNVRSQEKEKHLAQIQNPEPKLLPLVRKSTGMAKKQPIIAAIISKCPYCEKEFSQESEKEQHIESCRQQFLSKETKAATKITDNKSPPKKKPEIVDSKTKEKSADTEKLPSSITVLKGGGRKSMANLFKPPAAIEKESEKEDKDNIDKGGVSKTRKELMSRAAKKMISPIKPTKGSSAMETESEKVPTDNLKKYAFVPRGELAKRAAKKMVSPLKPTKGSSAMEIEYDKDDDDIDEEVKIKKKLINKQAVKSATRFSSESRKRRTPVIPTPEPNSNPMYDSNLPIRDDIKKFKKTVSEKPLPPSYPYPYPLNPANNQTLTPPINNMLLPLTIPQIIPQTLPQSVAQIRPQTIPEKIPQITPKIIPQTLPQTTAQTIPEKIPQITSKIMPQNIPQTVTQMRPQTLPEATSQINSKIPQILPQATAQIIPEITPQITPKIIPQNFSQTVAQVIPQTIPEITPKLIPQTIPQISPQTIPQKAQETQPQPTPVIPQLSRKGIKSVVVQKPVEEPVLIRKAIKGATKTPLS